MTSRCRKPRHQYTAPAAACPARASSWVVPLAGLGLTCVEEAGLEQLPQAALDARVHQLQDVQPLPLDGGQVAQLSPLDPLLHTPNRQGQGARGRACNCTWASLFEAPSLCSSSSLLTLTKLQSRTTRQTQQPWEGTYGPRQTCGEGVHQFSSSSSRDSWDRSDELKRPCCQSSQSLQARAKS